MARVPKLFNRVEKLLLNLLDEAETVTPAKVDEDGIEITPARTGASFGERLKLAEVATQFETRRAKVQEPEPSELDSILEEFHSNGNGTSARGRGRKARAPETNGIANAGRVLDAYTPNAVTDDAE